LIIFYNIFSIFNEFLITFDCFSTFVNSFTKIEKIIVYNLSGLSILTKIQQEAITGNLLGDGNLNIKKIKANLQQTPDFK